MHRHWHGVEHMCNPLPEPPRQRLTYVLCDVLTPLNVPDAGQVLAGVSGHVATPYGVTCLRRRPFWAILRVHLKRRRSLGAVVRQPKAWPSRLRDLTAQSVAYQSPSDNAPTGFCFGRVVQPLYNHSGVLQPLYNHKPVTTQRRHMWRVHAVTRQRPARSGEASARSAVGDKGLEPLTSSL